MGDGKRRIKLIPASRFSAPQYTWPLSRCIQKLKTLALIGVEKSYMPYLTLWDIISQNLAHLEANSHKIFQSHRMFRPSYNKFYEKINRNHTLLCLSQVSRHLIILGELQSDFCINLTEFYQISLKNLPYLTDFSPQLMACMRNLSQKIWLERKKNGQIKGMINRSLEVADSLLHNITNICTKFQNPGQSSSWAIFDTNVLHWSER